MVDSRPLGLAKKCACTFEISGSFKRDISGLRMFFLASVLFFVSSSEHARGFYIVGN